MESFADIESMRRHLDEDDGWARRQSNPVLMEEVPGHLQVQLRARTRSVGGSPTGTTYQRCGGGRRVIRRQIGGA